MSFELLKSGFPPVVIKKEDRLEYYNSLDIAHMTDDYEPFIKFIYKLVEESFEPYWFVLEK